MTIKIKTNKNGVVPTIIKKGDWIDLCVPEKIKLTGPVIGENNKVMFQHKLIELDIAIKLPSGFEAIVAPRSSSFSKYGIVLCNSIGVIDNSYCGNDDTWKFGAIAFKNSTIPEGARIAQFRIQLSQKANFFQKLRWLFSSRIRIKLVDNLGNKNRGGLGSTGI